MIPAGIAVVVAAPAGCSVSLQRFGFGCQADLGVVGQVEESGFGSGPPAEMKKQEKIFMYIKYLLYF